MQKSGKTCNTEGGIYFCDCGMGKMLYFKISRYKNPFFLFPSLLFNLIKIIGDLDSTFPTLNFEFTNVKGEKVTLNLKPSEYM